MRKKNSLTIFIVSLALVGFLSAPVMASGQNALDNVSLSGSVIFAGGWKNLDYDNNNHRTTSDMTLCKVELAFAAKVNEWVNVHAVLHYEDALWGDAHGPVWDEAVVVIGNTERFPVYLAAGLMYAPFGSFQTHFPADPVIAAPLTLVLGETQEKAVAIGVVHEGLSVCAYGFRGHWDSSNRTAAADEEGADSDVESWGADVHYTYENADQKMTIGGSYVSNVAETDTVEAALVAANGGLGVIPHEDIDAAAVYLHLGAAGFFLEAEYVTALEHFEATELTDEFGHAAKPAVWNVEVGGNFEVAGKNLELALKYAGSDETNALDLPRDRYGVCANLALLDHTTVSLGCIHDEYFDSGTTTAMNNADIVLAAIAVEF